MYNVEVPNAHYNLDGTISEASNDTKALRHNETLRIADDGSDVDERDRELDDQLTIEAMAELRHSCPTLNISQLVDECIARKGSTVKTSHADDARRALGDDASQPNAIDSE